jgi:uncharacterized iron-regulated membrane protein
LGLPAESTSQGTPAINRPSSSDSIAAQRARAYSPRRDGTVVVRKRVPGDPDPYAYSYVVVDSSTGSVLEAYDVTSLPLIWRLRAAMYAIHVGSPGGIALRLVYAIVRK